MDLRLEFLPAPRCAVCQLPLGARRSCGNPVCGWSDRGFDRIWAIAADTGDLSHALRRYKASSAPDPALAQELGLLLAAYIQAQSELLLFDVITATPSHVSPDTGRGWDHMALVVDVAATLLPSWWPFAKQVMGRPPIMQRGPTQKFSAQYDWQHRRALAEGPFRAALHVPDASAVRDKRILVVDDIFTEGLRTREVARALLRAGASRVCGLVLARHTFAPRWPTRD